MRQVGHVRKTDLAGNINVFDSAGLRVNHYLLTGTRISLANECVLGQGQKMIVENEWEFGSSIEHELSVPAIDSAIYQNMAIEQVKRQREMRFGK